MSGEETKTENIACINRRIIKGRYRMLCLPFAMEGRRLWELLQITEKKNRYIQLME